MKQRKEPGSYHYLIKKSEFIRNLLRGKHAMCRIGHAYRFVGREMAL